LNVAEQEVRILVVDDRQHAANALTAVLTSAGYDARAAYDGKSALEAAATFRPQVVLLDIDMPQMEGYRTAERLRQLQWDQPPILIAHTANSDVPSEAATVNADFDLHLSKPYEIRHLLELLERAILLLLRGGNPLRPESR
jgi:CheY-like chemotaxis protein